MIHSRTAALAVLALAAALMQSAGAQVSTTLAIGGEVAHKLTLSVADLRALPVTRSADTRSVEQKGATEWRTRHYAGVLLRDPRRPRAAH